MVLLNFSNIVVDDFNYGKRNPLKRYVYFLTHCHSDHYQGISNGWNYGQIYCSEGTKALLLVKFPKVANIITLPLNETIEIQLRGEYKVQVTLFDANHCPGSVMFLFQGYFGTVLHTGDMRFNMQMILRNPILYPPDKRNQSRDPKQEYDGCSIHIDEMILDNTYCDPIFQFPDRDQAFKMLCEIVDQHPNHRILVCVDSVGKEELMVSLAIKYETLVVVNEQKFEMIQALNISPHLFSTNRADGWIEVIRKHEREDRLKSTSEKCISITATGWANITGYEMPDKQNYIIPYSLHSNFNEMHQFVKSIRPCLLQKVVKNKSWNSVKIRSVTAFSQYMMQLCSLKQRGFEFFITSYTDATNLSQKYKDLMTNIDRQTQVQKDLGLILNDQEKQGVNTQMFESKHKNIFSSKNKLQKGAKFHPPEKNDNFKITQFLKVKKQISNIQESQQNENIILNESFEQIIEETKLKNTKQIIPLQDDIASTQQQSIGQGEFQVDLSEDIEFVETQQKLHELLGRKLVSQNLLEEPDVEFMDVLKKYIDQKHI